ncbi:hypothetical protein BLA6993_06206 [Burkholderia lata]|nr:hypothetical protein BLA6993_06206 [Burkholderia lata]
MHGEGAVISVDRAQELGDLLRVSDRGHVLGLYRRQGAAKVGGYVPLRAAGVATA